MAVAPRYHLTVEDLLLIADTIGAPAHRPRATAFGEEAYPTVHQKAAALLDAVVPNHYDLNGFDLEPPGVDEAVELVVAVAAGQLELGKLTERLASWVVSR